MDVQLIFDFTTDISAINIPKALNNPFGKDIPDIAKIAATEFEAFISQESKKWSDDFSHTKGKMFGVLVVQLDNLSYNYIGTVSGKLEGRYTSERFVPSVFDESTDDFFINKGMTELTQLSKKIKQEEEPSLIMKLREERKNKSITLQQRLFENYRFLNVSGLEKNLIEIFSAATQGNPPSAAGECAAPKLLQYALQHNLKPIAIAEFWWGNSIRYKDKKHKAFYPACKDKCRPILEYMLDDNTLYQNESTSISSK